MGIVRRLVCFPLLLLAAVPIAAITDARAQGPTIAGSGPSHFPKPEDFREIGYSRWIKRCTQDGEGRSVCFTGKSGYLRNGRRAVDVVLIEPRDGSTKLLRTWVALRVLLRAGTRLIVDRGKPVTGPHVVCSANGCSADYKATPELIGRLKKGRYLFAHFTSGSGESVAATLPLSDFAKAREGPASSRSEIGARQNIWRKRRKDDTLRPHLRP